MSLRTPRPLLAAVALAAVAGLAACLPWRQGLVAALTLAEVADVAPPAWLDPRPPVARSALTFSHAGRRHGADLYLPAAPPLAGLLLQPGATGLGRDDPRLVAFATTLARARFAVLVPELPELRHLQVRAREARAVADAYAYLARHPEWAPQGRAGIAAFSISVGLAMLAALEPDIAPQVRFLVAIGGYHDLPRTLRYGTTGYFEEAGQGRWRRPNHYAKWLFLISNSDLLEPAEDAGLLAVMAERRLHDPGAEVGDLVGRLGPAGQASWAYVDNQDPQAAAALLAALPAPLRAEIAALDVARRDLTGLRARVILIHGLEDDIIPYTESVALAAALPAGRTRLFLVQGLLHVETRTRALDAWRLWRAIATVLAEQDAPPAPD